MKSLFDIFLNQVRSREIWERVWELNRFKRFDSFQEYKERVSRRITKEDVPAIIVTLTGAGLLLAFLNVFLSGSNLTYAIFGLMVLFVAIQKLVERNHTK